MFRHKLPCSRSFTQWHNWPNTHPPKNFPRKEKTPVIFVAVLREKIHQIKGCVSVFLQTLHCFIWLLDHCIRVKLILPLPGLESGAGLAGHWAVAVAWTMWRTPTGILAVLQHVCKLAQSQGTIWTTLWGWSSTHEANGTSWCTSHSHRQHEEPIPKHKYICLSFFLRKQPPQMYFSASNLSGWNEPYPYRNHQGTESTELKIPTVKFGPLNKQLQTGICKVNITVVMPRQPDNRQEPSNLWNARTTLLLATAALVYRPQLFQPKRAFCYITLPCIILYYIILILLGILWCSKGEQSLSKASVPCRERHMKITW